MVDMSCLKCVILYFICAPCYEAFVPIVVTTWPLADAADRVKSYRLN